MPELYNLTPEQRAALALPAGSPDAPRDYWAAMAAEGLVELMTAPGDAPLGVTEPVLTWLGTRWVALVSPLGTPLERAAERQRLQAEAANAERLARTISPFQARAALLSAGLLPAVEALMANPDTPEMARLAWMHAQEFRRDSPTLAAMAGALGLDESALDALFDAAAGITA